LEGTSGYEKHVGLVGKCLNASAAQGDVEAIEALKQINK